MQYVTEVTLPARVDTAGSLAQEISTSPVDINEDSKLGVAEDNGWIPIGDGVPLPVVRKPTASKPSRNISEYIAQVSNSDCPEISPLIVQNYIIPSLPPAPLLVPPFTLGRLRVTSQRLYLAIQPAYGPFFNHLVYLATWHDRKESLLYCAVRSRPESVRPKLVLTLPPNSCFGSCGGTISSCLRSFSAHSMP